MRRDFDIFEKFADGSTLWRACVRGRFEARRKMSEFAERSENEFFMIDIQNHVLADSTLVAARPNVSAKSAAAR
jgi:hypothetical protein